MVKLNDLYNYQFEGPSHKEGKEYESGSQRGSEQGRSEGHRGSQGKGHEGSYRKGESEGNRSGNYPGGTAGADETNREPKGDYNKKS